MNLQLSAKLLKKFNLLILLSTFLYTLTICSAAYAQSTREEQIAQARQAAQSQSVDLSQYIQSSGNNIGRNQALNLPNPQSNMPVGEEGLPPPFGSNLFIGGFEAERGDGLNNSYLVAPGDKIAIQIWGAVNRAEILTVDNQGNIFITDVGPVKLQDVPANAINTKVTQSIKTVYTNNVNVYVNLLTTAPVSVYIAGPVLRPGQYAGLSSDSVLYYLKRAGGVDPYRGSYRNIQVLRDQKVVLNYDLYDFIKDGDLKDFSFKDQDVILVDDQKAMITVEGSARYPLRFEMSQGETLGKDIMRYAMPLNQTSHVAISGNRESGPISVYIPIEEFSSFPMADGDSVLFNDDLRTQVISVEISGSYIGPSFYAVQNNTRLLELLSHLEVDPLQANIGAIYIKRESVAQQQKLLLEESLSRLERSIFTAPATSSGEASIRAQEAELVSQFIARARNTKPLGKVIVSENGNVANIRLEQGDEIVIPELSDLIQVSGEVLMPQAFVYNPDATVNDYIAWAGGYSDRANSERIAIVRANGITTFYDADSLWFTGSNNQKLEAGDQILVLPKVDTKILQAVKDITQIIYQIAIAANAID